MNSPRLNCIESGICLRPVQNRRGVLVAFLFWHVATLSFIWGQSTTQFGFEEFTVGERPPFITGQWSAAVADSSTSTIQPFEGQKYLSALASTTVESPNGEPITSFSIHLLMSPVPADHRLLFVIGGQQQTISQYNSWQLFQGTLSSPVQGVQIVAYDTTSELIAVPFAIDAIEFVTIPEPQTFWLLSIGLASIGVRRLRKRSTNLAAIT